MDQQVFFLGPELEPVPSVVALRPGTTGNPLSEMTAAGEERPRWGPREAFGRLEALGASKQATAIVESCEGHLQKIWRV